MADYLIPTHTSLSQVDVEDEDGECRYLMAQLDSAKNPFNIVILDACRNNPWARAVSQYQPGAGGNQCSGGFDRAVWRYNEEVISDGSDKNGTFTKHLLLPSGTCVTVEQLIKR